MRKLRSAVFFKTYFPWWFFAWSQSWMFQLSKLCDGMDLECKNKQKLMAAVGKSNYKNNNLKYQISIFGQWLIWDTVRKHEEGQGSRQSDCKARSHNLGPSTRNNQPLRAVRQTGCAQGTCGRQEWRCGSSTLSQRRCAALWQKTSPRANCGGSLVQRGNGKRSSKGQKEPENNPAAGWNFLPPCSLFLALRRKLCTFKWNGDKTKQSGFII